MVRRSHCFDKLILLTWLLSMLLAGCRGGVQTPPVSPVLPSETPGSSAAQATSTPVQPTATPVPLAALVNGEGLTLAEYEAELARYQAAPEAAAAWPDEPAGARVLDDLIAQVLFAQAAREAGFVLDETALQERLAALAAKVGGGEALNAWISAHGYSEASFRQALQRAAAAAWMRDKIIAAVPGTAEQVHARQILLYNQEEANQVREMIRAGTDFATLAAEYDPVSGGDLGWFPRGTLTVPALEEAAFDLQEGQISEVVRTRLGYHILQVIERKAQHPLDPGARLAFQRLAVQAWLAQRRAESQIEILLP
jgi:peptidyl-prolyl cis-trans isomerase C